MKRGDRYKQLRTGREVIILDPDYEDGMVSWVYADTNDWHYCTVDEFISGPYVRSHSTKLSTHMVYCEWEDAGCQEEAKQIVTQSFYSSPYSKKRLPMCDHCADTFLFDPRLSNSLIAIGPLRKSCR